MAVVGVESCGKSTMVNHLIGTQALPTAAGMGTNSVMWVRNAGRTAVTVCGWGTGVVRNGDGVAKA